jgi:hypothetical protein
MNSNCSPCLAWQPQLLGLAGLWVFYVFYRNGMNDCEFTDVLLSQKSVPQKIPNIPASPYGANP